MPERRKDQLLSLERARAELAAQIESSMKALEELDKRIAGLKSSMGADSETAPDESQSAECAPG